MRILRLPAVAIAIMACACLLSACPEDTPAGADAALPDAIGCERDSDCHDDGRFCNGRPTCEEQVFMTDRGPWRIKSCQPGSPPCPAINCNETNDECACTPEQRDLDSDGFDSYGCGGTDCDDNDGSRSPGLPEFCDSADRDEDCEPATYGARDNDDDGYDDAACCNGDICGSDCDDAQARVHPTAVEACDSIDNDCNGLTDEGVLTDGYTDADGDGWGVGEPQRVCAGQTPLAGIDGDCDDTLANIHPGAFRCVEGSAIEICGDDASWSDDDCPGLGLCVAQPDGTGVCLPGDEVAPECSDGLDNDDDGQTDWSDPQCASPLDNTEAARACADGQDNDDDGVLDYPNDPGCENAEDNNEADPASATACSNGLDDDNDGIVDFVGGEGDPGCVSAADDSEREASGPACDNGLDDDGDEGEANGGTDFPSDKSCASPASDAELTPCNNGLDDDFDGAIDFPADPGCDSATDANERGGPNSNYPCDNSVDDDVDGVADFPADPGCSSVADTTEE